MTQQKFRYGEKEMKIALKQSTGLCLRGIIAVWQYCPRYNPAYTPDIQKNLDGFETPGFSSAEESYMLELVMRITKHGGLPPPQEKSLLKRMPRYARWLARIGNLDPEYRLPKLELPTAEQSQGNVSVLQWFYIQEPQINANSIRARIVSSPAECLNPKAVAVTPSIYYPTKSIRYIRDNIITNTPMGEGALTVHLLGVPQWLCNKLKLRSSWSHNDEIEEIMKGLGGTNE